MNKKEMLRQALTELKERVNEMRSDGKKEIILSAARKKNPDAELESLAVKVKVCKKCALGLSRIKAVFGDGCITAKVMFIGEGPGYQEDRQGLPFVGRAGKLLDDMMKAISLDRSNSYIANVVKCHPMIDPSDVEKRGNDRPPSPEEARACIGYLKKQIDIINPKILCVLGTSAMRYLLGIEEPIGAVRGKIMEYGPRKALVTYHPAALLRNPSLKVKSWDDLRLLKKNIK